MISPGFGGGLIMSAIHVAPAKAMNLKLILVRPCCCPLLGLFKDQEGH